MPPMLGLFGSNPGMVRSLLAQLTDLHAGAGGDYTPGPSPYGAENGQLLPTATITERMPLPSLLQGAPDTAPPLLPQGTPRQPSLLTPPMPAPQEPMPTAPAPQPSWFDKASAFAARWKNPTAPTAEEIVQHRVDNESARIRGAQFQQALRSLDPNDPEFASKVYGLAMSQGVADPNKIGSNIKDLTAPKTVWDVVGQGIIANRVTGEMRHVSAEQQKQYEPKLFTNGKTYEWVAPGMTPPVGFKPTDVAKTEITVGGANERARNTLTESRVKAFGSSVKPMQDRANVIEQAMTTISDAANNPDPAARRTLYSSAIANFVQAADQKAQLRYQMLNYFKNNVDPSIGGRWETLKDRLLKGELPQYSMQGMLAHLGNLKQLVGSEIDAKRNDLVKRHPELDGELPATDSFFASGWEPKSVGSKTMSRATFDKLSPAEQAQAKASGYVVK